MVGPSDDHHADFDLGGGLGRARGLHTSDLSRTPSGSDPNEPSNLAESTETSEGQLSRLFDYLDDLVMLEGVGAERLLNQLLKDMDATALNRQKGFFEETPMHVAAIHDNDVAVRKLLELGASRHIKNRYGETPLHLAVAHEGVLEELLKSHSEPSPLNIQDGKGRSPLMRASWDGSTNIVNKLLEAGADCQLIDNDGRSALHFACLEGHRLTVDALLAQDDSMLNEVDKLFGLTPLGLAVKGGHLELVRGLLGHQRTRDNDEIDSGGRLLAIASRENKADVLRALLEPEFGLRAQLEETDVRGETPLLMAAREAYEDIVRILVDAGANPNATNTKNGETALHQVSSSGHFDLVKFLLRRKAQVDKSDNNQWTPLHKASGQAHLEIVKHLVKKGAGIDNINNEGMSPLHVACSVDAESASDQDDKNRLAVIQYLLERKCDPFKEDKQGRTAFWLADEKGRLSWLLSAPDETYFEARNHDEDAHIKIILWATQAEHRHDMVKKFLMRLPKSQKKVYPQPPPPGPHSTLGDSNEWNAIEWAAFREMPWMLAALLAAPRASKTPRSLEKALSIASKAAENHSSSPQQSSDPQASGKKHGAREGSHERNKLLRVNREAVRRILEHPQAFTSLSKPRVQLKVPTPPSYMKLKGMSEAWTASVIHFHAMNDEPSFLRCDPSVYEVIYGEGPNKAVMNTKNELKKVFQPLRSSGQKGDAREGPGVRAPYLDSDATFRWVHLPFNNVSTPYADVQTDSCC